MTKINKVDLESMSPEEVDHKKRVIQDLILAINGKISSVCNGKPCLALPSTVEYAPSFPDRVISRGSDKVMPDKEVHLAIMESIAGDFNARNRREKDLLSELEEAKKASRIDALTKLSNKMSFIEALPSAVERVNRSGKSVYLVMMDLDHFKDVNDQYGHDAGDSVLKQLAVLLTKLCRKNEKPFRWGGEEFTVIIDVDDVSDPNVADQFVENFCERLRKAVEDYSFVLPDGDVLHKTISIGYCPVALNNNDFDDEVPVSREINGDTKEQKQSNLVVQLADKALYAAKAAGRNAVVKVGSDIYYDFLRSEKNLVSKASVYDPAGELENKNDSTQVGDSSGAGVKPENQV